MCWNSWDGWNWRLLLKGVKGVSVLPKGSTREDMFIKTYLQLLVGFRISQAIDLIFLAYGPLHSAAHTGQLSSLGKERGKGDIKTRKRREGAGGEVGAEERRKGTLQATILRDAILSLLLNSAQEKTDTRSNLPSVGENSLRRA